MSNDDSAAIEAIENIDPIIQSNLARAILAAIRDDRVPGVAYDADLKFIVSALKVVGELRARCTHLDHVATLAKERADREAGENIESKNLLGFMKSEKELAESMLRDSRAKIEELEELMAAALAAKEKAERENAAFYEWIPGSQPRTSPAECVRLAMEQVAAAQARVAELELQLSDAETRAAWRAKERDAAQAEVARLKSRLSTEILFGHSRCSAHNCVSSGVDCPVALPAKGA